MSAATAAAANAAPLVSVCISTRDRAPLLDRLLRSLQTQTIGLGRFEVVVTDDGSGDGTAAVLDAVKAEGRLALTVLRVASSRGPAAGRNAAWRAAGAPVIAFTDDDCVPVPTWLESGLEQMGTARRVVVGAVEPAPDQLLRHGLFAHTWLIQAAEVRWFATANCWYRRADLEQLGGFDERYRNPACEDTDLGLTAEEAGVEVVFSAATLVRHDVRPGTVLDKVRDQARWADVALVLRNHPASRSSVLHRGLFWKHSHLDLLVLLVGATVVPVAPGVSLALAVPWVHGKLCREKGDAPLRLLVPSLPGLLAVNVAEVVAMVRGSVRHRTLVL